MITKKDLEASQNRLEKRLEKRLTKTIRATEHRLIKAIKDAFSDFYETVFLPHVEQSENEHKQIREELGEKIDGIGEYIKDHEKRIRKLEVATGTN